MKLESIIKTLIVFLGIGAFVYLVSQNMPKSQGKGVIAAVMVGVFLLWWATSAIFNRARLKALTQSLTQRGLTVGSPKDAQFFHTPEKGQRSLTGTFWAFGTLAAQQLSIAEFSYLTGHGKHTQTIRNMQASRPCPPNWPAFKLSRQPGFLSRPVSKLRASNDLGLESEAFAKRWAVDCQDKDFAILLLSPAAQNWLMLAPKDEYWTIANGRVCVTRRRKCSAAETEALIQRLDELIAMLPQELDAW